MSQRKDGSGHEGDAPRSQAREFERGDVVLGRCVVDRCVRRDRLASFYSARALETGDEVEAWCSVWSVHVGIVRRSDRAASAFFDEMQHASAVTHPSIPAVIAFDPAAPGPVVIARQADGVSLRDRLAEGELLDTPEVARIVSSVADALEALHAATPAIIHRAVTPERVITSERLVSLEESGYAGALIASGLLTEKEVETFSQPGYRLPTKVSRGGGARIDAFLLAIVTYEALTGQLPFGAASVSELDELVERALPSARAARPTLPSDIDQVFARAWSPDPKSAYGTPAAFARDLLRALEPNEFARATTPGALRRESEIPTRVVETDDVDRAFEAMTLNREAPSEPPPTRKIDVEKLLPMVAAALHAGDEGDARGGDRRQGRALPPVSRALDLPPSKPTLLGAVTGSSRGPSPFAPRPSRVPEPVAPPQEPAAEDPTPVVGYEHLGSASLRDSLSRDSLAEGRVSATPDLSADAELQDRLSSPDRALANAQPESSVVELDAAFLEPSATNTNLERIMEDIASFRASDRDSVLGDGADGAAMGERLDDGISSAITSGGSGSRRPTPVQHGHSEVSARVSPSLRPGVGGHFGSGSTKTPLPPLPSHDALGAKRTPMPSIRPVAAVSAPPLGKGSSLPTTTPPPTRLSTPVPRGPATSARPSAGARRSLTPQQSPRVTTPPTEVAAPSTPPSAPLQRPWADGLTRVAPMIARTNVVAALIATVGLIYASRQLDAYYSDPAFAPPRDTVRVDTPFAAADAGVAPVDDIASATTALSGLDAGAAAAPDVVSVASAADVSLAPDVVSVASAADVSLAPDVVSVAAVQAPPAAADAGGPRRPAGVPGEATHARVWSQLSRRVADCVEGIENYNSVTIMVRFDGATGMIQRIRSRGIFGEPPVGPCLEQAVSGVRVAPFAAASWDTTFSFPIAPPRWRPPQ